MHKIGDVFRYRRMAKNVSSIMVGQGANFLLQAVYFVVLARVLGVREYGIFTGCFALVNALTPYTTLGAGLLFLRYVSLDSSLARVYWGNALVVAAMLSSIMALILFFVGPILTGQNIPALFIILAFANGLFYQIAAMAGQVFQTFEQLPTMAVMGFLTNFSRFVAVVILFVTIHRATAYQWGVAVLLASTASAIVAVIWVRQKIGWPLVDLGRIGRHIGEGFGFSFAGSTQAVYNDIDKTMLSHYGFTAQNGFYSLAYRIVEFATTPVVALDVAMLPGYFRIQEGDFQQILSRMFKSLRFAVLGGLAAAVGTLLIAPLVPLAAGKGFSGAILALRWLCWLPVLRGVHRMSGIALTGSGHQSRRTVAQCAVAIFNIILNFFLIPRYGWLGAAWSSLASDGLLGVLNLGLVFQLCRRKVVKVIAIETPEEVLHG
jgi:O-antigen/teichoic acid export membrane protein